MAIQEDEIVLLGLQVLNTFNRKTRFFYQPHFSNNPICAINQQIKRSTAHIFTPTLYIRADCTNISFTFQLLL